MLEFFRQINLYIGTYYADVLVLNGWDNLSNLLNLDIETVILYGKRAEEYAKRYNKTT